MMLPATSRYWFSAISCMCLKGIGARACGGATGFFWRQQAGSCHATAGDASRCPRRQYSAGTAISSDANGPTETSGSLAGRESQMKWQALS
jgi:hypothetical protein